MKDNHTPGPGYIEGSMNGVNTQIILRDKNHRLFKRAEITCWPGQDKKEANDSALLYNAAFNSYHKNCGDRAVECAEGDLLGQFIEALKQVMRTEVDGRISFSADSILAEGFRRLISQTTENK